MESPAERGADEANLYSAISFAPAPTVVVEVNPVPYTVQACDPAARVNVLITVQLPTPLLAYAPACGFNPPPALLNAMLVPPQQYV